MKFWQEHRFGDLVHFPPRVALRKGEEYPFIEMDVVNPNNRYVKSSLHKKYESSSCSKFANGDVLLARITPCLENGKIAQVKTADDQGGFGSTEFFVLRAKDELQDQGFLFYLTKCDLVWKSAVNSMVGASGRQRADATFLKKLWVKIPKPPIQRKISAVLTAYDELIENNQRHIVLLENLAEDIFREWFVRLRFPGYEKAKFFKGIPDGWSVKKLGELVRTQYGYTASAETEGDGPKFLRITDIVPSAIDWELVPHCKIEEKDEDKYLLKEGDILVARTGATVGFAKRINKHHPRAVFASYLVRLIPKCKTDAIFLGLSVERSAFKDFISMFVTGAAQPQANATTMALFPLLHPPEPLLNEFNQIAEPILDQKEILLKQMAALASARNQLLPRLISGKLSVENLDIQFPPSMAEEMNTEPTTTVHA